MCSDEIFPKTLKDFTTTITATESRDKFSIDMYS